MEALRHKRRETERNVELEQPSDGAERPGGRPIYWNRTSAHLSFALTAHVTSTSQSELENAIEKATRPRFIRRNIR